ARGDIHGERAHMGFQRLGHLHSQNFHPRGHAHCRVRRSIRSASRPSTVVLSASKRAVVVLSVRSDSTKVSYPALIAKAAQKNRINGFSTFSGAKNMPVRAMVLTKRSVSRIGLIFDLP